VPDAIEVTGLRVLGVHGVRDFEKERPQPFDIDVVVHTDLRPGASSDDLADTVSYSDVMADATAVIRGPQRDLLETLAEDIASAVLRRPRADSVEVVVRKPKVFSSLDVDVASVGVRITRP
jgi:FolB domain-containing protein